MPSCMMTQQHSTATQLPDGLNSERESLLSKGPCTCGEILDSLLNSGTSANVRKVNFRKIVQCFKYGERVTHSIHPYPAKLLPHIPHLLLSHPDLLPAKGTVGDPFCGSGTVLLESALVGKPSWGFDCNPLATLISQVKTTPIEPGRIYKALYRIKKTVYIIEKPREPDVPNLNFWFHDDTIPVLSAIANTVSRMRAPDLKSFFQIALSVTTKRLSLADPRIPVPVRYSPHKYPKHHWLHQYYRARDTYIKSTDPLIVFEEVVKRNAIRNLRLWNVRNSLGTTRISRHDAKSAFPFLDGNDTVPTTDLIITSPPYGSAQKYTRSTKLSLGWLSLWDSHKLAELEAISIGREQYKKSQIRDLPQTDIPKADRQLRAYFTRDRVRCVALAQYILEMNIAMQHIFDSLSAGGHLVLIMGDNSLKGQVFPTSRFIMNICENIGFTLRAEMVDRIKSRGLLTRRHTTSGIINNEYIMIFRKANE